MYYGYKAYIVTNVPNPSFEHISHIKYILYIANYKILQTFELFFQTFFETSFHYGLKFVLIFKEIKEN